MGAKSKSSAYRLRERSRASWVSRRASRWACSSRMTWCSPTSPAIGSRAAWSSALAVVTRRGGFVLRRATGSLASALFASCRRISNLFHCQQDERIAGHVAAGGERDATPSHRREVVLEGLRVAIPLIDELVKPGPQGGDVPLSVADFHQGPAGDRLGVE